MAYTKQTWHDKPATDTPISADRLTHIEDGVEAAHTAAAAAVQPDSLATVATSGAYTDLTGKPTIPDVSGKEDKANRNAANGYAGLDASGKVAAAQLPSYVDDVLEFASRSAFPATGETGKIYVATDNGRIYRWSGSTYVEIAASPGSTDVVPEGASNLYYTQARADARVAAGITGKANTTDLAAVAFSGDYEDLVNAPPGGDGGGPVDWGDVDNKPEFADVAFSGDYADLINVPAGGGSSVNPTVLNAANYTASPGDLVLSSAGALGPSDYVAVTIPDTASNGDMIDVVNVSGASHRTTVEYFAFLDQDYRTYEVGPTERCTLVYVKDAEIGELQFSGWLNMVVSLNATNAS